MATKKFKCKVCGYVHEGDKAPEKCPVCQAPSTEFEEVTEGGGAPAKKGLDTNSNVYTIVYASVMVVIVAFLLAFVSSSLKPIQDANVENDTKGQILTSLNIDINGIDVSAAFSEKVQDMVWDGTQLVPYEGAFNSTYGSLIKEGILHVFVAQTEDGVKYVIPVTGRGLWGGLWGYIALNEDKQTVYGTYFYHESETAGLGARIGERSFQELFNGRPLFAQPGSQTVDLAVVKSGAAQNELEVNGITGATLTSNGVNAMIKDGLGAYSSFIMGGASDDTAMACAPRRGHCGKGHCGKGKGQCGQGQCPGKCGDQCQCGDGQCGQGNCAECPKQGTSACCQNNEVEQN